MGAQKKLQEVNQAIALEVAKLPEIDRQLVLVWSQKALQISQDQSKTQTQKLRDIRELRTAPVVRLVLQQVFRIVKAKTWDERGWPARLALSGLTVGIMTMGGQGAGIAALGSAVGVPLFILTSAGGALLGTIIEEASKKGRDRN